MTPNKMLVTDWFNKKNKKRKKKKKEERKVYIQIISIEFFN